MPPRAALAPRQEVAPGQDRKNVAHGHHAHQEHVQQHPCLYNRPGGQRHSWAVVRQSDSRGSRKSTPFAAADGVQRPRHAVPSEHGMRKSKCSSRVLGPHGRPPSRSLPAHRAEVGSIQGRPRFRTMDAARL